jgi:hypothetical protein
MNTHSTLVALLLGVLYCPLFADEPAQLSLQHDGRKLLTYNARYIESPAADQPWYGRSGFIHPVYTPRGRVVTAGFPADHMHQHGLMFAWTSAEFDGRAVDFWNSKKEAGFIEHIETVRADKHTIVVKLRHIDETGSVPTVVLNETWEIKSVPHDSLNVFDLISTQTCATDRPLKIKKFHYGAMCIRGPSAWLEAATMVTDEGKQRAAGNHSRPNYVTLSGKIDGESCGIVAMSHPQNFRAPQPVRLHPNKPYFCFAPMVLGDFAIEPGQPYVSRYRFVAFDGEPDDATWKEIWQDYTR